jgi:hypothetical protein
MFKNELRTFVCKVHLLVRMKHSFSSHKRTCADSFLSSGKSNNFLFHSYGKTMETKTGYKTLDYSPMHFVVRNIEITNKNFKTSKVLTNVDNLCDSNVRWTRSGNKLSTHRQIYAFNFLQS